MAYCDKYRRKSEFCDREVYFYNDEEYEDKTDLIHIGMLGFCGCGSPENNVELVRDGLLAIDDNMSNKITWEEFKERLREIFGADPDKGPDKHWMLFSYWCDKEGLTEHGSGLSCGGWLSDKGREVLLCAEDAVASLRSDPEQEGGE